MGSHGSSLRRSSKIKKPVLYAGDTKPFLIEYWLLVEPRRENSWVGCEGDSGWNRFTPGTAPKSLQKKYIGGRIAPLSTSPEPGRKQKWNESRSKSGVYKGRYPRAKDQIFNSNPPESYINKYQNQQDKSETKTKSILAMQLKNILAVGLSMVLVATGAPVQDSAVSSLC